MRVTNGPMDVITRAEFDGSMKNFPTKDDLVSAVREAIRESLDDLKIDLSAQLEEKVTKSHNLLGLSAVRTSDLKDAKNEILATMRRNIGEAIDPLKADLRKIGGRVDEMGGRLDKMECRFDDMGDRLDGVVGRLDKMEGRFDKMEGRFDEMGGRLDKMGARVDEMHATFNSVADGHKGLDQKLTRLGNDIRETLKHHEQRLDRHDADLFKLRQSGVLQ
jgi:DNA anti-recombination protein RmuC